MARVWTDGAEVGDILFWDTATDVTASTTRARSGAYSYRFANDGNANKLLPTALNALYCRFCVWFDDEPTEAASNIFRFTSSSGTVGFSRDSTSGVPIFYRSTTAVFSGSVPIPLNQWVRVEMYILVANSGGRAIMLLDGVTALDYSGDTQDGASTTITTISLPDCSSVRYVDDLALNNTTGGTDDTYPGDGRIITLLVDGDGDSSQWTPLSGANYTNVDERPPDGDTSYVYTSDIDKVDLYTCLPFDGTDKTILRVWPEARMRGEVGGELVQLCIKTGGTVYNSGSKTLTTAYTRQVGTDYTTNPNTATAWTDNDLDNIQVGQQSK